MDLFIVEVLLATVVLRFIMVGALAYLLMSKGSACPHCGTSMVAVRQSWLTLFPGVERRFCIECGWSGFVRRVPAPSAPVVPEAQK
jgi:hypothetical protein